MKKYAMVGLGGRAGTYYCEIAKNYKDSCKLVGFCDVNRVRCEYANKIITEEYGAEPAKIYDYLEFEKMLDEQKPDKVIVTSIDRTHHKYIIRAMEKGYDVITEKPMTIDASKAQEIVDTIKKTGRDLCVTFNCRYMPKNVTVRKLFKDKIIGDVKQVHFEWFLNTSHGADYFRRWHRDKRNSGGLLLHKATHHFDLINFWLDTVPESVFAYGDLKFYGRENAEARGVNKFYSRVRDSKNAIGDPFAINIEENSRDYELYYKAEQEDGYMRDQSVFGDGISIEDTMNLLVRYTNGMQMSYSLNAYSPIEGFRVYMTGDKGRVEIESVSTVYENGVVKEEGGDVKTVIRVIPMFEASYEVPYEVATGGHDGADPKLIADIIAPDGEDELNQRASYIEGLNSIMIGIAANESMKTGMPIKVSDLVKY